VELPDMDAFTPNLDPEFSQRQISADDIVKTKAELDEHFKDPQENT
jgi:hypothetical protein